MKPLQERIEAYMREIDPSNPSLMLFIAHEYKDREAVEYLLEMKADVNVCHFSTLLWRSVAVLDVETVKIALKYNADPYIKHQLFGTDCFERAASHGTGIIDKVGAAEIRSLLEAHRKKCNNS